MRVGGLGLGGRGGEGKKYQSVHVVMREKGLKSRGESYYNNNVQGRNQSSIYLNKAR
jgi:hypothetical protein